MAKESAYFTLGCTVGKHVAGAIKQELDTLPGVSAVAIGSGKDMVAVDFDNTGTDCERIEHTLCKMGLNARLERSEPHTM